MLESMELIEEHTILELIENVHHDLMDTLLRLFVEILHNLYFPITNDNIKIRTMSAGGNIF